MATPMYPVPVVTQKRGHIRVADKATQGATIGEDLLFAGDGVAGFHELGVSTGLVRGGKITINALDNTKIDIAEGDAIFVMHTENPPRAKSLHFGPYVGVSITNIATQPVTYISIDVDGNVVQTPEELLNMQRRSMVELGIAVHTSHTNVIVINTLAAVVESTANQLHDFMEAIGPFNKGGNVYSAVGANLQIKKTAGDIFRFGAAFDITPLDPHTIDQSAVNPITFRYRLRDSTESTDRNTIDPDNYDLSGVLTAVQANRYTVQRIYMFQSGLTRIQYGQTQYQTLSEAINTFPAESFVTEENMERNGLLRAFLVIKQGATDLSNPDHARFFEVSKFGSPRATGGLGSLFGTVTTTATAGTASALPSPPAGYTTVVIGGISYKIPLYNP